MPQTSSGPTWIRVSVYVALFVYVFLARAGHASESLWLLADQIRDWRIALGPAAALPLVGTPSTAGGSSIGPIYYWVLWSSRVLLGPFVSNLPHAGVYGIALLQSAADLVLFDALRRRSHSTATALAIVLLTATAPHDLAVSGTIWNPSVSVAFVKIAIALRLSNWTTGRLWGTAATTAAAWLAVQAHSAAVFAAVPIIGSYAVEEAARGRLRQSLEQLQVAAGVIVLLQLPYLVHALTAGGETAPTRALAGASETISSGMLRFGPSATALFRFLGSILFAPWRSTWWAALLVVGTLVAAFREWRNVPLQAVGVAPLALAILGFSAWRGSYDEYWYLPLAPCAALLIVRAATSWQPRAIGPALCVLLALAQPSRLAASRSFYPMPQYGAMVRGAKRIVRLGAPIRGIQTSMPIPPLSDAAFPYVVMGGRLADDAPFEAIIDAAGRVEFRQVPGAERREP